MHQTSFICLYKGEIVDKNEKPIIYTSSNAYNNINDKTIYYDNFAILSTIGSILQADDIECGYVQLSYILELIAKYPNIKAAFGTPANNHDIFVCQGIYDNDDLIDMRYNLQCI